MRSRRAGGLAVVGALALFVAGSSPGVARAEADPTDAASAEADPTDEASAEAITPWPRPPVGVHAGYTLDEGQVVLAYRFERVGKNGLQSGTDEVDVTSVLGTYDSAPETLDLDRHVFTAIWSPVEQLTLQIDLPFVRTVTDQVYDDPIDGVTGFETASNGFGDVALWFLYRVYGDELSNLHLNLGLTFPSGSIGEAQVLPIGDSPDELQRLSYPLQQGSGTVGLKPGFTYRGRYRGGAWGLQAIAVLRAGTNEFDYILGNEYEVKAWGGYAWNDWLSNSFTLGWRQRFDGSGADALIDPASSPMADPDLLAYKRLDALFGLSITPTGGRLERTRWVLDAGLPAYQDLDGPQPRTKWLVQFALEVTI